MAEPPAREKLPPQPPSARVSRTALKGDVRRHSAPAVWGEEAVRRRAWYEPHGPLAMQGKEKGRWTKAETLGAPCPPPNVTSSYSETRRIARSPGSPTAAV